MSEIYDELFDFFDLFGESSNRRYVPLDSSPSDYKYYNGSDGYGIFVMSGYVKDYRETCSGIILESCTLAINNKIKDGYLLSCSVAGAQSEFARVCESLILTDRDDLAKDPSDWFDRWKETFGNTNVLRSSHSVIGELLVLRELIKSGYSRAIWSGPDAGICDVLEPDSDTYFEVKSTLARNSYAVTLSEKFQLNKADYLCFCRFEEDPSGEHCVDSVAEELRDLGYDKRSLDAGLRKLGIRNTSIRAMRYHLLELVYYPVKGNIPDIRDFFIGGKEPAFIEGISYSVNLSGLKHLSVIPKLSNGSKQ